MLQFEQFLLGLEEPSIVVMDNASYHSREVNRLPTLGKKKEELRLFMNKHGIDDENHGKQCTKKIMLAKINEKRQVFITSMQLLGTAKVG